MKPSSTAGVSEPTVQGSRCVLTGRARPGGGLGRGGARTAGAAGALPHLVTGAPPSHLDRRRGERGVEGTAREAHSCQGQEVGRQSSEVTVRDASFVSPGLSVAFEREINATSTENFPISHGPQMEF